MKGPSVKGWLILSLIFLLLTGFNRSFAAGFWICGLIGAYKFYKQKKKKK